MKAARRAAEGPARGAGAVLPDLGATILAPDAMAVVLQAASLLLDYPGPSSDQDLALVQTALAELPRTAARRRLERFLAWWRDLSVAERERTYVATFDLDRDVSLYLTEGRPLTSRERGAALLELRQAYVHDGAAVVCDELPDYAPLMLEAAAHVPPCRMLLAAERPALDDLAVALEERKSPFALVVTAVLAVLPEAGETRPAPSAASRDGERT
jgi:nitrate reductase molybdenum cofactor assembly chaperone NarJ/NarW